MPLIFPTIPKSSINSLLSLVDGIIITGGLDIDPYFYHERLTRAIPSFNPTRDCFEINLVKRAIQLDKPVLGLCRGLQVINVAMGGSLYQDINHNKRIPFIQHQQTAPGNQPTHSIIIKPYTYLSKALGKKNFVNSRHHEAVKALGKHLIVSAYAPDHIVEAVEDRDGLLQGVQWHPEDLCTHYPSQAKLFTDFLRRAKAFRYHKLNNLMFHSQFA